MNKTTIIIGIVLVCLIASVSAIKYINNKTNKCIGEKTKLFIQSGSKNAVEQINELSDDIIYFDVVDCFSNAEECANIDIANTPTWIINDKERFYKVVNINKLKELTNC